MLMRAARCRCGAPHPAGAGQLGPAAESSSYTRLRLPLPISVSFMGRILLQRKSRTTEARDDEDQSETYEESSERVARIE
jgi:hypothetical protein